MPTIPRTFFPGQKPSCKQVIRVPFRSIILGNRILWHKTFHSWIILPSKTKFKQCLFVCFSASLTFTCQTNSTRHSIKFGHQLEILCPNGNWDSALLWPTKKCTYGSLLLMTQTIWRHITRMNHWDNLIRLAPFGYLYFNTQTGIDVYFKLTRFKGEPESPLMSVLAAAKVVLALIRW